MKQQVLQRARSTVDGFLHRQCADTALEREVERMQASRGGAPVLGGPTTGENHE